MTFNVAIKRSLLIKTINVSWIQSASISTENLRVIDKPTLDDARRGTGYRSSFNGIVCTVFGGSGFYGKHVIGKLGKHGTQIVIPYRCSWDQILPLRTASDLGQMQFCDNFHLENEDSIRKAIKYSDVVINLIGRDYDSFNWKMEKVHIDGARRIARLCREMGVKKLIHTSTINALPFPPELNIKGGSRFLKSKWAGEQAVREEFPDAIIVRPADTFGTGDRYISYYGCPRRLRYMKELCLWNKGLDTIKQPVYIGDVAAGYYELVKRNAKDVAGKTYQFIGPEAFRLYDLCYYMFDFMNKDVKYFQFSVEDSRMDILFQIFMWYNSIYYSAPNDEFCWERFERENLSDQVDGSLPTLRDLDVKLNSIEDHIWTITRPFRAFKSYFEEPTEYVPPPLPPTVRRI